jgi:hypothetical protein
LHDFGIGCEIFGILDEVKKSIAYKKANQKTFASFSCKLKEK